MKILFFNDTRIETNPGCHATVNELTKFTLEYLSEPVIEFLPLGTEYDVFSGDLFKNNKLLLLNSCLSKLLLRYSLVKPRKNLNVRLWEKRALKNLSIPIREKICSSDLVLINMEGTIHNNSIGGLVLLAIAYYSKRKGKKVALVNGSYQEMDSRITKKVLKEVDFISVRETKSLNYLVEQDINVSLIPDFAFRADINLRNIMSFSNNLKSTSHKKKCLYTVGVLGVYPQQINGIELNDIKNHISDIKRLGYVPYYLKIEEKESGIERELRSVGVNIISYEQGVNYSNIGTVLNSFDLLITGRYHIGIFGLMNSIPTFFLKSNTYKIEGLLDMLDLNENMIFNNDIYGIKDRLSLKKEYTLPDDNSYIALREFLERINI